MTNNIDTDTALRTERPAVSTSTIRPGLLVSLKTSLHGNVRYDKRNLGNTTTDDGASVVEWETTRTVYDPIEHKLASKVRQDARNRISAACIGTAFGLLCPNDRRDELDKAVREARAKVREFNATAKLTTVRVYVVAGYIADNDVEAMKAIASEVQDLFRTMEKGIENVDAAAIRDAASRALKVGQMLTPQANERVKDAVKMARDVARKIVKAGESAAQEVDKQAIKAIAAKRTAFLDLTEADDLVDIKGTGRAVELEAAAPLPTIKRERLAPVELEI